MAPFPELRTDASVAIAVLGGRRPSRLPSCSGKPSLDGLWDLLQNCWKEMPASRPTASQIVESLMGPDIKATTAQSIKDWDASFTSRFRRCLLGERPLPSVAEFQRHIEAQHKAMEVNQLEFQPFTRGHGVPRVRQREDDMEEEVEIRPLKKGKLAATR
jgi:hypothetical protein